MGAEGTFMEPAPMHLTHRPIGSNDVGVVAWLLTMRTPECPQGRQVHLLLHIEHTLLMPC